MHAAALAIALALLAAAAPAQEPPAKAGDEHPTFLRDVPERHELLVFEGNLVFNEFALRAQLALPADARATPELAKKVMVRLTRFLRDAGYELATVLARVEGPRLIVTIDEGRLDKVIIVGVSSINALRLRLQLALPADVFNRPLLEQRLRYLAARMGLRDASYQLLKVHEAASPDSKTLGDLLQIDQLGDALELRELGLLHGAAAYELRLVMTPDDWGSGFSPEVILGGLDGLGIGVVARGRSLLLDGDKWAVRVRGAIADRRHLDTGDFFIAPSRAFAQALWLAPPLSNAKFRPIVEVLGDLVSRQRPLLLLERFVTFTLEAAGGLSVQATPNLFVSLSGGYQQRWLFGLVGPTSPEVDATPRVQRRPFGDLSARLIFNPDELRHDHQNGLQAKARLLRHSVTDGTTAASLRFNGRFVVPFGWNELWLESNLFLITGDVYFVDQLSLGEVMKSVFGDVYTQQLAQGGAEFRFSLVRDLLKLGVLLNLAAYASDPSHTGATVPQLAGAVGVGLHALFLDAFAADLYFSGAVDTLGRVAPALALNVEQVF